ncbi:hypothetical protein LCGC14_1719880, partial [marine sediment metagenome]
LNNDRVDIKVYVGASQSPTTYRIDSGNDGTDLYINLNNVIEPLDDSWSWADVGDIEVRLDGTKAGSHDSVQDYEVFEVWGMIHTSGGGSVESDWLRATNFDFSSIPDGSNITGIEVELDRKTTIGAIKDLDIRLRRTSGQVGDNKLSASYWDTIDNNGYDTYGGSSDTWNAGLSAADVKSSDFGIDIAVINDGSDDTAFVDHIQIKVYYTEPDTLIQTNNIIRPDGDITTEWESSHVGNHFSFINETNLNMSDYIYTSSIASNNITDEFSMGTFDINSGSITQIQVEIYGNEIDIASTIEVSAGTWSDIIELNMGTTPSLNTYSWSGLDLSQSDLDVMTILFESEPPQLVQQTYENFDYVDFDDILDNALGTSDSEFMITAWVYPTQFTSNISINGVKNVFFSKTGIIELGVNETGFLQVHILTDNINATAEYGFPGAVTLNSWNYIAVRYNISGNDVDVLVGDVWCREAIGATPEPWTSGGTLKEGGKLIIGAEISTYSSFTGRLDDISIFNKTLSDLEVESHSGGPNIEIDTIVKKEDSQDLWIPITIDGEVIEGRLKFDVNSTGKPIDTLEFYLTSTEPDLQNPDPNDWNLLGTDGGGQKIGFEEPYYILENSWNIPDNDTWYFVCKASDDIGNVVYDYYSTYFGIEHFDELINFTTKDTNGRIGVNPDDDHIGVSSDYKDHISSLDIYINKSDDVELLSTVNYSELDTNYWVISLSQSLSDWITTKSLSPDNWKKQEIQVLKGSKAYKVLVPIFKRIKEEQPEGDQKEKTLQFFKVGNVFDISCTSEYENYLKEQIEIDEIIMKNSEIDYSTAIKFVSENFPKINIIEDFKDQDKKGSYDPLSQDITLNQKSSHTLFHELGHLISISILKIAGHIKKDYSKNEVLAELTAYLLLKSFDENIDYNFPYSNVWANRITGMFELDEFINSSSY